MSQDQSERPQNGHSGPGAGEERAGEPGAGESSTATVDVSTIVDQLRAELADAQQRLLRERADNENFRKRMRREQDDERRYANLPLLVDLLPVLDNAARAIEAAEKTPDAASLLEGFKLMKQQLEGVLQRHHCHEIKALGEPFDPNRHSAICGQPSDKHNPNTVLAVAQAGFQLHDRVIRPSQVVVSTAK